MFNAMMKVQWKWSQPAVMITALLGFAIPLASVRLLLVGPVDLTQLPTVGAVVRSMQAAGVFYAALAALTGLCVGVLCWSTDHKGRHVYALSLPITRAHYALNRFGAGTLFLLIPAIAVLVGGLIAISVATLPPGMHGYALALTARFFICSFLAFSIFFAISAASQNTSAIVLGSIAGLFVLLFLLSAAGVGTNLVGKFFDAIFNEPGLLSVFTGRWMLIDV